jgi:UDP-N-acetylglucosamine 2-epimerase (non-hydrolysing)
MADLLWTPSADGDENLLREGISPDRIDLVGNTMIDAYCRLETAIHRAGTPARLSLPAPYVVVTMHRPANVDAVEPLSEVVGQLVALQRDVPVVFPVHPRTFARLKAFDLDGALESAGVRLLPPLGYVEFMSVVLGGAAVITDSGGIQEETSYLGIPCLTVRDSTERPVTITLGTNRLVTRGAIVEEALRAVSRPRAVSPIPYWDGHAADRCVRSLRARV